MINYVLKDITSMSLLFIEKRRISRFSSKCQSDIWPVSLKKKTKKGGLSECVMASKIDPKEKSIGL